MVAVLAQTTLVPELQTWMNRFIVHQKVNKFREPHPVEIPDLFLGTNSFIELLFNDSFSGNFYEWRWMIETSFGSIPRIAIRRLQVYVGSWQYLKLDASGDNVFNLQQDDFTMLNALLVYRNDSTGVSIVDSTAATIFDSTANVLTGSFDSLTTELSKLIWLFLDLKIRGNLNPVYNSENPLSTGGFIETCYEQYVLDQYFKFLSNREPDLIDGGVCEGT